jgi:molybdopterin-containing oxidoreductase family iron-sulfur binding subunit
MKPPTLLPSLPPAPGPAKDPAPSAPADFASLRRRLEEERGRGRWRSLEELAAAPEFEAALPPEFAEGADSPAPIDRREAFRMLGVSFALAGLTACTRQPEEKIVPYVRTPEDVVPGGTPLFFATSMTVGGYATGLLVESHQGRPTKAEGNALHPASLGAADVFGQASLYGLYDPDRSQTLTYLEEIRPWPAFLGAMRTAVEAQKPSRGAGLRILTETVTSPTLAAQIHALLAGLPEAKWVQWEPLSRDAVRHGARLAFGEPVDVVPNLSRAAVILSLGSDFLGHAPGHLRMARDFAARRRELASIEGSKGGGVRLYVVETAPTITGANADHRLAVRPSEVERLARSLMAALGGTGGGSPSTGNAFLSAVASDLAAHRGSSLILVGDEQPPAVHALGHAINAALGNFAQTVTAIDPVEARPADQLAELRTLVEEMDAGRVDTLLILGGNPVYDAPADFRFAERLAKVRLRVHLSLYADETSTLCQWHVPRAHFLESWSDARAFDGTASIVQPLIAPLYDGRTEHEVLGALTDRPERSSYEVVRDFWRTRLGPDFEGAWRRALHDGLVADTAFPARNVPRPEAPPAAEEARAGGETGLEALFRGDPNLYDGRFANNGWLHELPRPITKLSWDNAALFSIATAGRLGLKKEDVVRIAFRGASIRAAVWIEPGVPDETVLLHLGNGRRKSGRFGTGLGFDAYPLRFSDALWSAPGVEVRKEGDTWPLACTQLHQNMVGRDLARAADVEEFRRDPDFAHRDELEKEPSAADSLYRPYPSDTYAWGLSIDLNACIGCNACVLACQAENNIPVVGKDQVRRGREMHWLRVDHYYGGNPENPEHFFQPVPCMHCEDAPCELVCPVGATVHSAEGLNDMIYNRCVGTRYCSNNCPYKVRRFNFYHYSLQFRAPSMKMLPNPDVTVRWRGVMEKCTYCVQRIQGAKIAADIENRRVRDGEITTACAQTCPTQAIVFGDLADADSRLSRRRREPRSYALLSELGTRPRTSYLAGLRNPSPKLPRPVRAGWSELEPEKETGQR